VQDYPISLLKLEHILSSVSEHGMELKGCAEGGLQEVQE